MAEEHKPQISGVPDCFEAHLKSAAFAPHRHDTYTFALTTSGVQSFNYRGALRHSLPGQVVVLHPDELHDGQAGTEQGFGYKSTYIPPSALQSVLEGRPLPYLPGGVSKDRELLHILKNLFSSSRGHLPVPEYEDILYDLAMSLERLAGGARQNGRADYKAVEIARAYIDAHLDQGVSMPELEKQIGCDRWKLARDFRLLLGTSPYRYLIMRRLDKARRFMRDGKALADIAHACSFADQSHFNRHFKKVYGLSPKVWMASVQ